MSIDIHHPKAQTECQSCYIDWEYLSRLTNQLWLHSQSLLSWNSPAVALAAGPHHDHPNVNYSLWRTSSAGDVAQDAFIHHCVSVHQALCIHRHTYTHTCAVCCPIMLATMEYTQSILPWKPSWNEHIKGTKRRIWHCLKRKALVSRVLCAVGWEGCG